MFCPMPQQRRYRPTPRSQLRFHPRKSTPRSGSRCISHTNCKVDSISFSSSSSRNNSHNNSSTGHHNFLQSASWVPRMWSLEPPHSAPLLLGSRGSNLMSNPRRKAAMVDPQTVILHPYNPPTIEYGVYGDLIIYPTPCSIYLKGNLPRSCYPKFWTSGLKL